LLYAHCVPGTKSGRSVARIGTIVDSEIGPALGQARSLVCG
jgi:hypothetical protein